MESEVLSPVPQPAPTADWWSTLNDSDPDVTKTQKFWIAIFVVLGLIVIVVLACIPLYLKSDCPAGSSTDNAEGTCQKCPPGTGSSGGSSPCVGCDAGTYSP
jgi:hypothetical protein